MTIQSPQVTQPELTKNLPVWRQLRWSLILLFVVLAIMPMVVVTTVITSRTITQARSQTLGQLRSVAELKREDIVVWLRDAQAGLEQFAVGSRTPQMIA
jgi:hypothetical protein